MTSYLENISLLVYDETHSVIEHGTVFIIVEIITLLSVLVSRLYIGLLRTVMWKLQGC